MRWQCDWTAWQHRKYQLNHVIKLTLVSTVKFVIMSPVTIAPIMSLLFLLYLSLPQ